MAVRRFVLAPLAEIAPEIVDMQSGRTIAQLLANLDRRPSYVALDAPPGPHRDELFRRRLAGLPAVGLSESRSRPDPIRRRWSPSLLSPDWSADARGEGPRARCERLASEVWGESLARHRFLRSASSIATRTIFEAIREPAP